ncbi:hypothetical protein [Nocardia sp. NPDC019395]|uniref:hypothetical protein n=1 Tax=Nocardia sp. NPDC019395 TaxID=3154686 RepID=UPI0033F8510D
MVPELVERLLGVTKGMAGVIEGPLRDGSHGLRRASGIGQTDEEIAQSVRGIDSREIDRNRINSYDYRELYLEAKRFDDSDAAMAADIEPGRTVSEGDPALARILSSQGFDGPPLLVDAAGMRRAIDSGWEEMFRGVHGEQRVADFKIGPLRTGRDETGRGNGIWVWGRAPSWSEYGSPELRETSAELRDLAEDCTGQGRNPRGVIRMAMHPDALVTDLDSLAAKQRAELRSIDVELGKEPEGSARRTELEARSYVLQDVGRFGAASGYDGYWVNGTPAWVFLNRTVFVVER